MFPGPSSPLCVAVRVAAPKGKNEMRELFSRRGRPKWARDERMQNPRRTNWDPHTDARTHDVGMVLPARCVRHEIPSPVVTRHAGIAKEKQKIKIARRVPLITAGAIGLGPRARKARPARRGFLRLSNFPGFATAHLRRTHSCVASRRLCAPAGRNNADPERLCF